MSTDTKQETLENSELINWVIFSELLLMDEDEEGFAQSLITTFVEQALGIFKEMDELLSKSSEKNDANLTKLSNLGHYLKGSAAALGLHKIQEECERIQNYGAKISDGFEQSEAAKNVQDWFDCCANALTEAKKYFKESGNLLSDYFDEDFFATSDEPDAEKDTEEPEEAKPEAQS
ncbi:unnamed protein product [Kuraishia capsulata CBS 1993]|uniref:HPt domain-containing protein n=1 Tax=Kuraishia capsulata CBS 1993 TaxID=1382522 RepID=W6MRV4_9ASCO|nr:uncharacterized protein KUCA_T00005090001 [Kuraishia capsulata CBS 1993]CDK29103.1 unnamed protein product [Kuraishia capsulata CBS 1993]